MIFSVIPTWPYLVRPITSKKYHFERIWERPIWSSGAEAQKPITFRIATFLHQKFLDEACDTVSRDKRVFASHNIANIMQNNKMLDNEMQDNKMQDNKMQDNKMQDNKIQDNTMQNNKMQDIKI